MNFSLSNNTDRIVRFSKIDKKPQDTQYQAEHSRIPPQTHY
jgi:hypothetical protein